ncbi:Uncharacterised protein [Vibrio cholerae]|nr:Uncharacterised protein [Vibrio cholerae]
MASLTNPIACLCAQLVLEHLLLFTNDPASPITGH